MFRGLFYTDDREIERKREGWRMKRPKKSAKIEKIVKQIIKDSDIIKFYIVKV